MRILAVSGSLRRGSHNSALLGSALDLLLASGVEMVIYDALRHIPPYDEDVLDSPPASVQQLRDEVNAVDAVLISTPEYNHSVPGQLKNALDWLSRPLAESPLRNKPAAVIGASTGMFGAVWAQAELRKVLAAIGARVLDRELPVPSAHQQFTSDGRLADREIEQNLASILRELVDAANAQPQVASGPLRELSAHGRAGHTRRSAGDAPHAAVSGGREVALGPRERHASMLHVRAAVGAPTEVRCHQSRGKI
jgi:chromate reductase, NAD(P)H dehydrogenase (quinone)